mmetsp:Transcript_13034/g.40150  ORF Transcript_13034/g.40150 Transcript_13034/m.40150 type:complete len:161 (+) Transcript_13034:916-1398(+)
MLRCACKGSVQLRSGDGFCGLSSVQPPDEVGNSSGAATTADPHLWPIEQEACRQEGHSGDTRSRLSLSCALACQMKAAVSVAPIPMAPAHISQLFPFGPRFGEWPRAGRNLSRAASSTSTTDGGTCCRGLQRRPSGRRSHALWTDRQTAGPPQDTGKGCS